MDFQSVQKVTKTMFFMSNHKKIPKKVCSFTENMYLCIRIII